MNSDIFNNIDKKIDNNKKDYEYSINDIHDPDEDYFDVTKSSVTYKNYTYNSRFNKENPY